MTENTTNATGKDLLYKAMSLLAYLTWVVLAIIWWWGIIALFWGVTIISLLLAKYFIKHFSKVAKWVNVANFVTWIIPFVWVFTSTYVLFGIERSEKKTNQYKTVAIVCLILSLINAVYWLYQSNGDYILTTLEEKSGVLIVFAVIGIYRIFIAKDKSTEQKEIKE